MKDRERFIAVKKELDRAHLELFSLGMVECSELVREASRRVHNAITMNYDAEQERKG